MEKIIVVGIFKIPGNSRREWIPAGNFNNGSFPGIPGGLGQEVCHLSQPTVLTVALLLQCYVRRCRLSVV